jgi:hypothetical protein
VKAMKGRRNPAQEDRFMKMAQEGKIVLPDEL